MFGDMGSWCSKGDRHLLYATGVVTLGITIAGYAGFLTWVLGGGLLCFLAAFVYSAMVLVVSVVVGYVSFVARASANFSNVYDSWASGLMGSLAVHALALIPVLVMQPLQWL